MLLGKYIGVYEKDFCFWSIHRPFHLIFSWIVYDKKSEKLFSGAFFGAHIIQAVSKELDATVKLMAPTPLKILYKHCLKVLPHLRIMHRNLFSV